MYKIYQVENNETLESIAQKLNTDVDTLKNINGIKGSEKYSQNRKQIKISEQFVFHLVISPFTMRW